MLNDEKIVILDWGGVVESHFQGENNCYSAKVDIINRLNEQTKKFDATTICKKWIECDYDQNGRCISEVNSREDIQKWFERIKLKFDLKCDYNEFYAVYKEESDKIKYYKEVVDFAHSLKNKCKIGILSNLADIDRERIDKHYDLSKFDYVWLSFDLKCKKPNQKIYDIVVNDCKLNPNNILFIDDKEDNLEIPKRMGWQILQATGHDLDKIKEKVYEFLNKNRSTGN